MKPEIPISVNKDTGVWSTDGLEMLYVPRHFFNNLHLDVQQALGYEKYQKILYASGHKSAYYWCDKEAKTHSLKPYDCYVHYLKRLSQRGWGLMQFEKGSLASGKVDIRIDNSVFVLHKRKFALETKQESACYLFNGWFAGAADWWANQQNLEDTFQAFESSCACKGDGNTCRFTVVRV